MRSCLAALCALLAVLFSASTAYGQVTVLEVPAMTFGHSVIDMDNIPGPAGPTTLAAVNAAGVPLPGNIAAINLIPNPLASPAPFVYNTFSTNGRALALDLLNNGLQLVDPNGGFDAFDASITLGMPSQEFGVQLADQAMAIIFDFYLGPNLVASFNSASHSGTQCFVQMIGGTFDRVDFRGTSTTYNWVINELHVQTGSIPNPVQGVYINEFYTGAIPAVEIYNSKTTPVDLSGFVLAPWYSTSSTGTTLTADAQFVIPAGTIVGAGGFLVLEAGGTAGAPGTYPNSMATGNTWAWTGAMTLELALTDSFAQGIDYVLYDHFGNFAGLAPNLPAPTAWTGNFAMGTGDTHARVTTTDTNTAADWMKVTLPHSLGTLNPPQASKVQGVLINEFYTGTVPAVELYNSGSAAVDLSGLVLRSWTCASTSSTTMVADPIFSIPVGTTLAGKGFLVLEAGGVAGMPGTYPSSMYTGNTYAWTGSMCVELTLTDSWNSYGADYVFYDHFGNFAGLAPNLPPNTSWTGNFAMGTGDTHARVTTTDTDTAADWTKVTFAQSLGLLNPPQAPQITGLTINEFYTGAVPAVELYNTGASTVDLSGLVLRSWTCASSTSTTMVADPIFTIPAGTTLATKSFLVLEAGGTAGLPGTYPNSMYTGNAYAWTGTMCVEITLTDSWSTYGVDYVFYDHFGTFAGLAPNLPPSTFWTGNFAMGSGNTHERVQVADTDNATDWAKNANPHSLGTFNPPQASGTTGILINEVSTGNPDWIELINTTANPVDVSGYVLDVWYGSSTGVPTKTGSPTIPTLPPIPAGGVVCLVESGTAGAVYPSYPNSYYTGISWPYVSTYNVEVLLSGPLGIVPLDYVIAGINEAIPPAHKPATTGWDGTLTSVGAASADIFERLTLVDRDNANDWVRAGVYTSYGSPGALNPVQAAGCNGYFSQYGTGCTSASGNPLLFGTGCPAPGSSLTIEFEFAPVGASAMMVLGLGNLSIPLSACCNLQVAPIVSPQIFLVMPAATLSIPATIPATLPTPVDAYVQTLFGDTANPCGISSTNPLQLHFQ